MLDWFQATAEEQAELAAAAAVARACIEEKHRPDGYNLGLNCGEAAGHSFSSAHARPAPLSRRSSRFWW